MLDKVKTEARLMRGATAFDVEIAAVATAVPPNSIGQTELKERILHRPGFFVLF